jgi:hypothetical protein
VAAGSKEGHIHGSKVCQICGIQLLSRRRRLVAAVSRKGRVVSSGVESAPAAEDVGLRPKKGQSDALSVEMAEADVSISVAVATQSL